MTKTGGRPMRFPNAGKHRGNGGDIADIQGNRDHGTAQAMAFHRLGGQILQIEANGLPTGFDNRFDDAQAERPGAAGTPKWGRILKSSF